ncbi:MAG: D-alanyl-D-alanine carboxypeptidase family protein [Bacilli bacterium]|nr:D-alanyl-D-alanine carboxypeptidase family protein [Bacilli bacterium]
MKKLLIMIMCLTLIAGCGKKETTKEKEPEKEEKVQISVELEDVEVEVNGEVTNTQGVINVLNGEIVSQEEKVDTSVLGEKIVTIIARDLDGEEKEFSYKVKVVDTTPPVITYKESLSTTAGTKIDLLKNVSAKDNSGEKIKVTVEGKYDFEKTGTYKLQYVAKDSSGNETKKDFTLTVKEKPVQKDPEPAKPSSGTNTSSGTVYRTEGTDPSLNGTKTSKGYTITVKNGITYIDGIMIANKTYAVPASLKPGGLTSDASSAFNKMKTAAKNDGVSISVVSGYRSYDTQKNLWTKRKNKYGIDFADGGTARPGHSEHQTGLGMDINMVDDAFENTAAFKWLQNNAYKYGFILRYPKGKTNETGYKYESWHFRYVGVDLATKLYNNGDWITLENHFGITSKYDY